MGVSWHGARRIASDRDRQIYGDFTSPDASALTSVQSESERGHEKMAKNCVDLISKEPSSILRF